ncbi:hypothetical protein PAMA_004684 [Pampus argenteus]
MSKLSFRARALDATKPLPVFRCEDLPDLHEYASINRAVPQMPTGMEKEEESTLIVVIQCAVCLHVGASLLSCRLRVRGSVCQMAQQAGRPAARGAVEEIRAAAAGGDVGEVAGGCCHFKVCAPLSWSAGLCNSRIIMRGADIVSLPASYLHSVSASRRQTLNAPLQRAAVRGRQHAALLTDCLPVARCPALGPRLFYYYYD